MCPGGEAGAGLAPACWPDQKPVRLVRRDPSQFCRPRFHPQTDTGCVPQRWAGGQSGMLADQLDYVVGVDPHRDSHALAVVEVAAARSCSRRPSPPTAAATRSARARRASTRRVGVRSRSKAPALRRRPDALPDRPRRAGARGRPAAARASLGRQDRRARRGPGRPQRARAGAARDAARRRRTRGAAGADGRTRRRGQREDGPGSASSATC